MNRRVKTRGVEAVKKEKRLMEEIKADEESIKQIKRKKMVHQAER